ncbi:transcription factor Ouib-like [Eupeodes corollae]|uniref:transcription factor Ouib-like n=1 Tax=Eupeodes corollae TaxID=290404 RepID=UPI00249235E3|nr:transcription factor Ouib-like [Eupeodes corollae]
MSDIIEFLETCRICKENVPIENNVLQIYDTTCVRFLEEIKEISGVDFNGVFEQPWYICMNCYTTLTAAQLFRKRCIESYELFKNSQRLDGNPSNEDLLEKILNYNPDAPVEQEERMDELVLENEPTISVNQPLIIEEVIITNVQPVEKTRTISRICEICGNVFEKKRNFKLHLQRHTNNKRFECELCLHKFHTNTELKCHMRKHTGEKPYQCKYCHRKFSDYGTHKKHERTHTNERPFCCNFCEKSFTNQFMLKNHILIHTGKRNYKCHTCNRDFIYPGHLTTHLKSLFHKKNLKLIELGEKI